MPIYEGKGYKKVRVVSENGNKNYTKVKQVANTDAKNYINVADDDVNPAVKDYHNVLQVAYDDPKDYLNVNFIPTTQDPIAGLIYTTQLDADTEMGDYN